MSHTFNQRPAGIWLIGVYKLAKALLILAAGAAFLLLPAESLARDMERLSSWLGLEYGHRLVRQAVVRLEVMDRLQQEEIGVAVVLYGLLYVAQSAGLLLRRRWGAYLVVVTTGFLLPFEAYEVFRKLTPTRVGVLAVNLAIVAYLVSRLRQDRRVRRSETPVRPGMRGRAFDRGATIE